MTSILRDSLAACLPLPPLLVRNKEALQVKKKPVNCGGLGALGLADLENERELASRVAHAKT